MRHQRSFSNVFGQSPSFFLAALIGVISMPFFGHANILTNGSFESGLTGWTITGVNNVLLRTDANFPATDGHNMINFNGGQSVPNGTLSQTFPTLTGHKYTIAYDYGNWGNFLPITQTLGVTLQGNSILDQRDVTDSTIDGSQNAATVYNPFSYTFVADSLSTTLTFTDKAAGTNSSDGLLDNVRINEVPEPSMMAFVGVGLVMLFRSRRAKSR